MSCGRICKTTPCTYPACATPEQHAAYAEGREDAELDAARMRQGAFAATEGYDPMRAVMPPLHGYADGYSDGYDAALIDEGAHNPWWIHAGVFLTGVLVGVAVAWLV